MLGEVAEARLPTVKPEGPKGGAFQLLPGVERLPVCALRKGAKRPVVVVLELVYSLLGMVESVCLNLWLPGPRPWAAVLLLSRAALASSALLAVLLALRSLTQRTCWTFHRDHVEFERVWLLHRKEWTEPLTAYRGVLARRRWEQIEMPPLHVFTLVHTHSRRRSIVLEKAWLTSGLREALARYARLFGKPALIETESGLEERTPDDLESSLRKRVLAGKVSTSFEPTSVPSDRRLTMTVDGDTLLLRIRRGVGTMGIVIPAALLAIGAAFGTRALAPRASVELWVVAFAFLAAGALAALGLNGLTEELRISPFVVAKSWRNPWGLIQPESALLLPEVTDVIVGRVTTPLGKSWAVQVMADSRVLSFGEALSRPARQWVRDCIVAAVSR
jgi:hypothetical protein